MQLKLATYGSPIGTILLVVDQDGVLRALDFEDYRPRMNRLLARHYRDFQLANDVANRSITTPLDAYFDGELTALEVMRTETNGTFFQRSVWTALRGIPAGATTSYGVLAAALGRPQARRAVGMANGANPVAIIVPCHRVIGASGDLTGFGGGLERKRWLLDHERKHSKTHTIGTVDEDSLGHKRSKQAELFHGLPKRTRSDISRVASSI